MPNLGAAEIIAILVVALLVLGPKRLPEVGRKIGGFVREFRRQSDSVKAELRDVIDIDGVANEVHTVRRDFRQAVSLDGVFDSDRAAATQAAPASEAGRTRRLPGKDETSETTSSPPASATKVTRRLPPSAPPDS